jgi:sortase A
MYLRFCSSALLLFTDGTHKDIINLIGWRITVFTTTSKVQDQTGNNRSIKFANWLRWQKLAGFAFIIIGLVLIISFVKPYLYLTLAKPPDEVAYPLNKEETIKTINGQIIKSQGKIFIPAIKMVENLLEGVNRTNLDYGISHYSGTSEPGMKGNIVLTGHNFYGRSPLFSLLHRVKLGDQVIIHYQGKRYLYEITSTKIISPENLHRYQNVKANRLTMITCYPPGYTSKRLIVIAKPKTP